MRHVVGRWAKDKRAASTSQMGRFETEVLTQPENLIESYSILFTSTNFRRQQIVSSIVCKFYFVPSGELSEDGSFDGRVVVEAAHRTQTLP